MSTNDCNETERITENIATVLWSSQYKYFEIPFSTTDMH